MAQRLSQEETASIIVNLKHNIIAWLDPVVGGKATYGEIISILGRAFALAVHDYMTIYIACHYVPKEEEDGRICNP